MLGNILGRSKTPRWQGEVVRTPPEVAREILGEDAFTDVVEYLDIFGNAPSIYLEKYFTLPFTTKELELMRGKVHIVPRAATLEGIMAAFEGMLVPGRLLEYPFIDFNNTPNIPGYRVVAIEPFDPAQAKGLKRLTTRRASIATVLTDILMSMERNRHFAQERLVDLTTYEHGPRVVVRRPPNGKVYILDRPLLVEADIPRALEIVAR